MCRRTYSIQISRTKQSKTKKHTKIKAKHTICVNCSANNKRAPNNILLGTAKRKRLNGKQSGD